MDPASIVGVLSGIVTLTKLLDDGLSGLTDFIIHTRKVDEIVQSFHDDIEALSVTLAAVAARFRGSEEASSTPSTAASREATQSLSISVAACQRLMRSLSDLIPNQRIPIGSNNYFRRLLIQRRLSRNREVIRSKQGQIQIHTGIINTAFNLIIFDCVSHSVQNQQINGTYRNLVGSLEELRRAGTRLPQNHDAESAVAFQAARALSTTAESALSDTVSVVGRNSRRTASAPRSAPVQSHEPPLSANTDEAQQAATAKHDSEPRVRPQNSDTGHSADEPTQERQGVGATTRHERDDSGYASVVDDTPAHRTNFTLPVSPKQLRREAQRLLQSHGHPINRARPFMNHRHKQALEWAATEGHVEAVKHLVEEQGTPFELQTDIGAATLFSAIDSGHTEVVKFLLSLVATVELKGNAQTHNALVAAAQRGDYAVMGTLLDKGADPNSRSGNQDTPLHVAAKYGYLNVTKQLLLKDADVFAKDERMRTPLHIAVSSGSVAVTRVLLEHRSEVDVKDSAGNSPFHFAFYSAELDIFNCLVDFGARIQLSNDAFIRSTVLDQLLDSRLQRGFRAFVECLHTKDLLTYYRIEELVHYIAAGNHRDALNYLCDKGVLAGPHIQGDPTSPKEKDADHTEKKSFPFLSKTRSLDTLPSLPAYEKYYRYSGVDVLYEHDDALEDQHGRNEQVLKRAVDAKDGRIFREGLDQMKAAPGHPHWPISANTVCHVVNKGDIGMLQALFWTKVDINGTDVNGWAAIHYTASKRSMHDKLVVLHGAGADVNVKTTAFYDGQEAGETALSLALMRRAGSHQCQKDRDYWEQVCLALHARGADTVSAGQSSRVVRLDNGSVFLMPSSKKVLRKRPS